jgi:hypothetical protein
MGVAWQLASRGFLQTPARTVREPDFEPVRDRIALCNLLQRNVDDKGIVNVTDTKVFREKPSRTLAQGSHIEWCHWSE